jgi:O6-methylguanine-DNA--protein-cysteine methyltransferase
LEIKTSWGVITLTLKDGRPVALDLPHLKTAPKQPFASEDFQGLEDLLKNFPNIGKLDGTEFQKAVWNELKKIPRGQTRTYGEIAAAIGRPNAVRAVGSACGAFGSGLPWKILLLKIEGIL